MVSRRSESASHRTPVARETFLFHSERVISASCSPSGSTFVHALRSCTSYAQSKVSGRYRLEQLQYLASRLRLPQPRKNLLDAVTMRTSVRIGHSVHDQHNTVAVIIGAACRRLDAGACRHTRQKDLVNAALTQVLI